MKLISKPTATYFPVVHTLHGFIFYPRYTKIYKPLQVSANSHPREHISQFVDSHLKPLVPKLPSYIKDTTYFLKKLDDLKELPPRSLLVTLDVSSLYT